MRAHLALPLLLAVACASGATKTAIGPDDSANVQSHAGIRYAELVTGTGGEMAQGMCVFTHYTGWRADGVKFDSSRDGAGATGDPVSFVQGAGSVMQGWEVGFDGMRVGGKRRLFVPYQLAYGERGNPPVIPRRTSLVFEVELVGVARPLTAQGVKVCPAWASVRDK